MRLALFSTDRRMIRRAEASRISEIIVDWESWGKGARQAGNDTEINNDTPQDLQRVVEWTGKSVVCRLNSWHPATTPREIESAIERGADLLLLPMVTTPSTVESFLRLVNDRAGAGILVETAEAVACASELASFPLDLVYVGFNDLAVSRGSCNLFEPLVDGTVDRLAESFTRHTLGFGGLTVLHLGMPIPCRLLLAEMARTGCSFTFLRRSFKADIEGRDLVAEVDRLGDAHAAMIRRTPSEIESDRRELLAAIDSPAARATLRPSLAPDRAGRDPGVALPPVAQSPVEAE